MRSIFPFLILGLLPSCGGSTDKDDEDVNDTQEEQPADTNPADSGDEADDPDDGDSDSENQSDDDQSTDDDPSDTGVIDTDTGSQDEDSDTSTDTETSTDLFYVAPNGVTVMCPDAEVNDTGVVNGVTYTKRDRAGLEQLKGDIATMSPIDWTDFEHTCTSGIGDMSMLFQFNPSSYTGDVSTFNADVGSWDVSNVSDMEGMFINAASFNQDIGSWDVSNVSNMKGMFSQLIPGQHTFNQDIGSWDVSNVSDMRSMFNGAASFNQDIGSWNVSNVNRMEGMFSRATSFNQDLSGWCVSNFVSEPYGFQMGATSWTLPQPVWGTCP